MHFSPVILLISSATAAISATTMQSISFMAGGIEKRDVCVPVPEPVTCARSCGAGSEQCVYPSLCYNPTKGQKCCSNGKYCDPGYYCTDGGCCPEGSPLDQCGATITLSVIPPAGPEATSAAISEATSATTDYFSSATTDYFSSATTDYSTSTSEYTSLATYTEVESSTTTSSTDDTIYPVSNESITPTTETAYPPVPSSNATVTSNITATYAPPAQYTGGTGKVLDNGIAYFSLGGLGALLMFL